MYTKLFQLCKNDWVKGLIVAVLSAVVTWLAAILNVPGFDFATFDWGELSRVASAAFIAYLSKNLLTTDKGNFAGAIKVEADK